MTGQFVENNTGSGIKGREAGAFSRKMGGWSGKAEEEDDIGDKFLLVYIGEQY